MRAQRLNNARVQSALMAQRSGSGQSQAAQERTRPAPIGGWNTRDPKSAMPPLDAVEMINLFPDIGEVRLRPGYVSHGTGVGSGNVEMVGCLEVGSVAKLIAAGGGAIYDVTTAGAGSSLASGFTGNRWNYVSMNGVLGLVNGEDAPQTYDGSTVSAMTISGSGLTPASLDGVHVHAYRSYFWDSTKQEFWYSAVNTLGGALTKFDVGNLVSFGGNLVSIKSWTIDGGEGRDDLLVLFFSSGQVIVYSGTDPGQSLAIVGRFAMAPPVDHRAIVQMGGDLLVLTDADILPLSKALPAGGGVVAQSKLAGAITSAVSSYGANTGWAGLLVPEEHMVVWMIPITSTRSEWYGFNTVTGAPFRYTGMNARSWVVHGGKMYYGGVDGTVYKFGDGVLDDAGSNIEAEAQTAWERLLGPGAGPYRVSAMRQVFTADGDLSVGRGIAYDFASPTTAPTTSAAPSGSVWDTALWDVSLWSPEESVQASWQPMGSGSGRYSSTRVRVATQDQVVRWFSSDYMIERGFGL